MDGRRPWTLVWVLAAVQLVAWGSLYYVFPVIIGPMEAEFGWSKTALNGAVSVGLLVWGLAAPFVGAWIDRRSARGVMTAASLLGGVLLAAWSQIDAVWILYAVWIGLGGAMAGLLYEPAFAVVAALFGREFRKAITVITLLGGFASTVFIPGTQWLVEAMGWRDTLALLGVLLATVGGLAHWLLLPPDAGRFRPATQPAAAAAASPVSARPAFWGLALWFTAYGAVFSGLTFHLIPLLRTNGVDMAVVLMVVASIGPMQVAGRLVLLGFARRLSARTSGAFVGAAMTASVAILLLAPYDEAWLLAFAALYGAANGIMTIVRGTAVPEFLADAGYAATNGALAMPANIAKAAAPVALAYLWTESNDPALVTAALLAFTVAGIAGYSLACLRS